jgi:hypothetical protein
LLVKKEIERKQIKINKWREREIEREMQNKNGKSNRKNKF